MFSDSQSTLVRFYCPFLFGKENKQRKLKDDRLGASCPYLSSDVVSEERKKKKKKTIRKRRKKSKEIPNIFIFQISGSEGCERKREMKLSLRCDVAQSS